MRELLVIATPVNSVSGMPYGGMLRMRTPLGPAYAAFQDRALAETVAAHWNITRRFSIRPWMEALADEPQDSRAHHLLVFESEADFWRFLLERDKYPFGNRLVPIGPHAVPDDI